MYRNLDWWDDAQRAHDDAERAGVSCPADCPICDDPTPRELPADVIATWGDPPLGRWGLAAIAVVCLAGIAWAVWGWIA